MMQKKKKVGKLLIPKSPLHDYVRQKIWIEELLSGRLDRKTRSMDELGQMIGFVAPNGKEWDVALLSGATFSTKSQELAEIIAQNETIIALLLKK